MKLVRITGKNFVCGIIVNNDCIIRTAPYLKTWINASLQDKMKTQPYLTFEVL